MYQYWKYHFDIMGCIYERASMWNKTVNWCIKDMQYHKCLNKVCESALRIGDTRCWRRIIPCFPRQKRRKRLQYTVAHGITWFITAFLQETSNSKWINIVHYIIGVLFACREIPLLSIHMSKCIYTPRLEVCTIHGPSNRFGKEGMKKLTHD